MAAVFSPPPQSEPHYATDSVLSSLKLPPHSIEAEQSVLGGLLLNNEAWDRIGDIIAEEDFYRDDHRRIYHAISKLIEHNKPADVLTAAEALQMAGDLQNIGGMAYLHSLAEGTPIFGVVARIVVGRARDAHRHSSQGDSPEIRESRDRRLPAVE